MIAKGGLPGGIKMGTFLVAGLAARRLKQAAFLQLEVTQITDCFQRVIGHP
jgi:hypothetical protein